MDFIMEHVGIFIGVGVVLLLAIIGYFADKKDNEKRNREIAKKKNDNPVNNYVGDSNYASPIGFNELPIIDSQVGNVNNSIHDTNIETVEPIEEIVEEPVYSFDQTLNQAIDKSLGGDLITFNHDNNTLNANSQQDSDVINSQVQNNQSVTNFTDSNVSGTQNSNQLFGFSNFENLDMSLEDLEKKNYDSIVSNNKEESNDDNFYYSDMDDDTSSVSNYDEVIEDKSNTLNQNILSDNSIESDEANSDINSSEQEVIEDNFNPFEQNVVNSNEEVVSQDTINENSKEIGHEFDGEVSDTSFDDLAVNENNNTINESIDSNIENSGDYGTSFDVDSDSMDDIWKF